MKKENITKIIESEVNHLIVIDNHLIELTNDNKIHIIEKINDTLNNINMNRINNFMIHQQEKEYNKNINSLHIQYHCFISFIDNSYCDLFTSVVVFDNNILD